MLDIISQSEIVAYENDRKRIQLFLDMKSNRSARTAKTYASDISRFINKVNKPFTHVTLSDVNEFAKSLSDLAPSTQLRIISVIKSLYKFLSSEPGYLLVNPFAMYEPIKLEQNTVVEHVLTKEEVESIRDVLRYRNKRNWLIVTLLYATGIRIDEFAKLRWCDVISDEGNIGLRVRGKRKKIRYVKLSKSVYGLIINYRIENRLNIEIGSGDTSALFINRNGTGLTARYVQQFVSEAAKIAGINKPVSPHWFRHSHATSALRNGADLFTVKESLGHENIQTTIRYLHTINKLKNTTADYIELDMN